MSFGTNAPPYAAPSLPAYTPHVQPNERSLDNAFASTSNAATSDPLQEYRYKNGRLKLNLGPKRPGMFRPAYGWNDSVDGYVQVKKSTKNVLSIVATVEGHVTTGLSERGFLTEQTKTNILRISQTLFDASSGQEQPSDPSKRYTFSIPLPSYVTGGTQPLPPTFAALHPGVGGDVTYSVTIDMVRKGMWRQNEKIKAFIYYLPRTYAPLPRFGMLSHDDLKSTSDDDSEWRVFSILPKIPQGVSTSGSNLAVSLALPRVLIFAAGSPIPFAVTLASGTAAEALPLLFSCLSVQLVRVTILTTSGRRSLSEATLGCGEVFRIETCGNATRTMFGSVTSRKNGEASWGVDGVEVKYIVRVRLAPPRDTPSLASALPTYMHEETVTLTTHQHKWEGDEAEAMLPALCRAPRPAMAMG